MGGAGVAAGEAILDQAPASRPSPTPTPPPALFTTMWRYADNLRGLYETPTLADDVRGDADRQRPRRPRSSTPPGPRAGRCSTEFESKQLLAAYGIPTVETRVAATEDEAVAAAEADRLSGRPQAPLARRSRTRPTSAACSSTWPTPRPSARAYRAIEAAVRERAGAGHFQGVTVQPMVKLDGYELIVGSSLDPQFGPVLLFGTGGQLVEVFRDRALALPPLNTTLARRMMEQTRIYAALQGRARPQAGGPRRAGAAPGAVQPAGRRAALDQGDRHQPAARLARRPARARRPGDRPRAGRRRRAAPPRPAIRPYPSQYVDPWTATTARRPLVRPIRPEDEPLLVEFHETLSERTVSRSATSTR